MGVGKARSLALLFTIKRMRILGCAAACSSLDPLIFQRPREMEEECSRICACRGPLQCQFLFHFLCSFSLISVLGNPIYLFSPKGHALKSSPNVPRAQRRCLASCFVVCGTCRCRLLRSGLNPLRYLLYHLLCIFGFVREHEGCTSGSPSYYSL